MATAYLTRASARRNNPLSSLDSAHSVSPLANPWTSPGVDSINPELSNVITADSILCIQKDNSLAGCLDRDVLFLSANFDLPLPLTNKKDVEQSREIKTPQFYEIDSDAELARLAELEDPDIYEDLTPETIEHRHRKPEYNEKRIKTREEEILKHYLYKRAVEQGKQQYLLINNLSSTTASATATVSSAVSVTPYPKSGKNPEIPMLEILVSFVDSKPAPMSDSDLSTIKGDEVEKKAKDSDEPSNKPRRRRIRTGSIQFDLSNANFGELPINYHSLLVPPQREPLLSNFIRKDLSAVVSDQTHATPSVLVSQPKPTKSKEKIKRITQNRIPAKAAKTCEETSQVKKSSTIPKTTDKRKSAAWFEHGIVAEKQRLMEVMSLPIGRRTAGTSASFPAPNNNSDSNQPSDIRKLKTGTSGFSAMNVRRSLRIQAPFGVQLPPMPQREFERCESLWDIIDEVYINQMR
ncbi:hypothetical protein HK098_004438 [Nowakowskiella sp. JEL0407]|nr:hypothetical protein HK098_004438 [Nowakowskiella sp. JEL0407]